MDFVSLSILAAAAVGLGSAATVLLSQLIPQSVAQAAAQHGRFAGLGERRGAYAAAHYAGRVQHEAMNGVGTSN
ncbi:MAG TPA: hypothetical protein VFE79_23900 [Paraburkholderia sp.]|nr:hypothetical protein [Paraburkholderia sp.]